ncbi:Pre-mRNA-splicing factor ISY1-like [Porphyridium purpureum]|uniref:Pre-mRNA-splicing factor ISY1-like n=1 Tax=Porphyridium purpureum TaxID=35688 RepID=A0A5J4YRB6_PORPP|nr:Pre-mRNA-splicing factor ISY1-like [Porphyridium purpureum]|eukprot:POR0112..scf236_6
MARSEEKAQSMLHRYLRGKADARSTSRAGAAGAAVRPRLAVLCDDVAQAQLWQRQVVREFVACVSELHDETAAHVDELEESERLMALNDRANKLLREKRHWDRQVRRLARNEGDRSRAGGAREDEAETIAAAASPGTDLARSQYIYFGRARHLPLVQEQLERERIATAKRKIAQDERRALTQHVAEIQKRVRYTYYVTDGHYGPDAVHQVSDDDADGDVPVLYSAEAIQLMMRKQVALSRLPG